MRYSIGVDIGGTNIAIGIVECDSHAIIAKTSVKTRAPRPALEICEQIMYEAKKLCESERIDFEDIEKIGIATRGIIKNSVVVRANTLGWTNVNLSDIIAKLSGKPCYVANDANAAAYAEVRSGVGVGASSLIAITLGTGVGGGIVLDGKIWEGINGFAAEIGHMVVDKDGRECSCGKRGCLEAYCSATAIAKATKAAMLRDSKSLLWRLCRGDVNSVNGATAFVAAARGDNTAKNVIDEFVSYLAVGVANIINVFQPEVLCIGGGISGQGDTLLLPLRERLRNEAFATNSAYTKVCVAKYGNDAGIIGAGIMGENSYNERSRHPQGKIVEKFLTGGAFLKSEKFGNGHINETYKVTVRRGGVNEDYILQKMNKNVFREPWHVMENMMCVTDFLARKYEAAGEDTSRKVMRVIRTTEGNSWYCDKNGEYWRLMTFIKDSIAYDRVERPEQFYECAKAFGEFQRDLAEYPAITLREIIKDFHNTPKRYENLMKAVSDDVCGRREEASDEISFAMAREEFVGTIERAHARGEIPLRVTHNDTKLNNILFDSATGSPICVVDLDTIMPGYSVFDFGDAIRFGASSAKEDETDLSLVTVDLSLYELYVKGYIEAVGSSLTEGEINNLTNGAIMMTLECGMRFLTDYLSGDTYFRISRPKHNLERARNQFKLVREMEAHKEEMEAIVAKIANNYIQK